MASRKVLSLTATALLVAQTHGSAIETNPTSLVEDVAPLTHFHPAYGAAVADEIAAYEVREFKDDDPILVVGANLTAAEKTTYRSRELETTNRDLQKLEDHFQAKMEVNLKALAELRHGAFDTAPWPSSYWPIYQDGINAQWDPTQKSPAEKYALGFGLNPKQFMDKVSQSNGILSQKTRRKCTQTSDCDSLKDGSICGIRAGEASGFCIPGWFGICHAWAPAAILEKEPKCAVTRGNVTFEPFDIKALLTQVYDGAAISTVFTGARFNGPNEPEKKDEFGRYTDAARRDLGPGFFHIAIANIMGKFKKSFVVDVTAGAEVWNQPAKKYDVLEMKEMDLKEASQQFFQRDTYPFNKDAKHLAYVKTQFYWIVEALENGPLVATGRVDAYTESATYEYLLELDEDRNVIGGEWLNDSRYNHPDFLWFPKGKPVMSTETSIGLKFKDVEQLLQDSLKCEQVTPAPTTPLPTTPAPTTPEPTTPEPTTPEPTTPVPTTPLPTTPSPTTAEPTTTPEPSTAEPTTTPEPSAVEPSPTPLPTTGLPTTTPVPTTVAPVTETPSTTTPTTTSPATDIPTTETPTTTVPATTVPATTAPAADVPTTDVPTTDVPATTVPVTTAPSTPLPTTAGPTTEAPATTTPATTAPTTPAPTTEAPPTDDSDDSDDEPPATVSPQTPAPTQPPATAAPTEVPATESPATDAPSEAPSPTTSPAPTTSTPSPTTTTPAPSLPIETPAQCGKSHVGVDFYGDDIRQVYWVSQAECCDECAQTQGCKGYTFIAQESWGGSSCYLKSGRGSHRPHAGAISAMLEPTNSGKPGNTVDESKCAPQQQNVDFYGADLWAIEAPSVGKCCDACAATKRCKAYTFIQNICYLKKGTGTPRFTPGAFSGVSIGKQNQQQQW